MNKTTLKTILEKYELGEYEVGTDVWEMAQEDADAHWITIKDYGQLYIIDIADAQGTTPGFYDGRVITIEF